MKVAIIGAGLSGLSCAFGLRQYGLEPVIYELRNRIGDAMCTSCIDMRIFSRDGIDNFSYISKKYGLDLKPLYLIKKIIMKSERKTINVNGKLGNVIKRGPDAGSLENQIAAKINMPVLLDSYAEISRLRDFDKIVVATGNNVIPSKLEIWKDTFTAMTRYATVLGEFETDTIKVWFNTEYAKNSYCYLVASSPKEASIVLLVNNISWRDLDYYWKKFLETEQINYPIIQIKDAEHKCGIVRPFNKGNIYITGNAAGFTDDFVGIGAFNAIESGILAARAIGEDLDYNRLVEPIFRNVSRIHEYRNLIHNFENKDFDKLLTYLNFLPVKHFIYHNPLFNLSRGAFFIKALNRVKR